jgi:hypothetical protein
MRGERNRFAKGHAGFRGMPIQVYGYSVNYGMNRGLDLYPRYSAEIEALRRELLAAK